MVCLSLFPNIAANIFNQYLPDGIIGMVEIFFLCCLVGGIAAFYICRTRHSHKHSGKSKTKFTEVNSRHWVNDRNKDGQ
ncbi:MAG: hypothetical protein JWP00_934 [Chloroflexi bacterium]|nr:hypothetical protein [Chloroflexota bacterium]